MTNNKIEYSATCLIYHQLIGQTVYYAIYYFLARIHQYGLQFTVGDIRRSINVSKLLVTKIYLYRHSRVYISTIVQFCKKLLDSLKS